MNLFRILLLCLAVWIVWRLLRGWRVRVSRDTPPQETQAQDFEKITRCAQCGVHLPVSALSPSGRCGKCSS